MSSQCISPVSAHRRFAGRALLAAVLASGCAVAAASPSSAATHVHAYVVTGEVHETHEATGVEGDVGLCTTQETAEFNGTFTVRLLSTVAGLSDDEVLALLEAEPDGTVLRAGYRESGALVQRSGPHTYSMRYTSHRAGKVRGDRVTFRSSFIALGRSEQGTRYSIHAGGKLVLVDGESQVDRDWLHVRGCLP
jgi:hypothetical protein